MRVLVGMSDKSSGEENREHREVALNLMGVRQGKVGPRRKKNSNDEKDIEIKADDYVSKCLIGADTHKRPERPCDDWKS